MLITLGYIGTAILFVNTLVYGTYFAKKSKAYKIFCSYLLCIFCIQVIMHIYSSKGLNNHFLSTYYLFLRFVLLSGFFHYLFKPVNKKVTRLIKYVSTLVVAGLTVQYVVAPELYYTFNSLGFLATGAVLLVYCVLYLYEMLSKKLPFYFVTIGLFIYLMSSSLVFVSATSIISIGDEITDLIWDINAILFIIYQFMILWEWKRSFFRKKTT